jgi:uncharacterized repeat protein (TIGR01451 family)
MAALLSFAQPQLARAHTCPPDASGIAVGITLSAFHSDGTPFGRTGRALPCETILVRMSVVYVAYDPFGRRAAAFEGGRMLLTVGAAAGTTDVTPNSGIPLIGGNGTLGCNGLPSLNSRQLAYTVTSADVAAGQIRITAVYTNGTAHIRDNLPGVVSGSRPAVIAVTSSPPALVDLGLAASAVPEPVTAGSNLTYVTLVTNNGKCPASDVRLRYALPESVTFVSAPGCDVIAGVVTCNFPHLAPGTTVLRSIAVRRSIPGALTSRFTVTSLEKDSNAQNNSVTLTSTIDGQPLVTITPASTNVALGSPVRFCAQIGGPGPYTLQWRRNGVNLAGETNQCILIEKVDLSDGGAYTVIVANNYGAVISPPAYLNLNLPPLQGGDELTNRTDIGGFGGFLVGTNVLATSDPNEPRHYGKPGGHSLWYSWTSPGTGIATFRTVGSIFDTLLAIYVECPPGNLMEVASDDDRGTNLTSFLQFNALRGVNYLIAVDGFAGATGLFALTWEFQETSLLLPVILEHPVNVTVAQDERATFSVSAIPGCVDSQHGCDGKHGSCTNDLDSLSYQWFFNGVRVDNAVSSSYSVTATERNVGSYFVRVTRAGRSVASRVASLQINSTGGALQQVQAYDKFGDTAEAAGIELGGFKPPVQVPAGVLAAAGGVVRGYSGTQVFNTTGSSTEPGDQLVCGVIGGASQWIAFVPLDTGMLYLSTDGSSYNTVMAVFIRPPNNPSVLQLVDCDNNGGLDGRDSALSVPVQAGVTNFVMVDGVNGATGILQLNYSLVIPAVLRALGLNGAGQPQLRLIGHPEMRFMIERSANAVNWLPLMTTNANIEFNFTDTTATGPQSRFYRATMLP